MFKTPVMIVIFHVEGSAIIFNNQGSKVYD